ncbi:hypothetical protein FQN49_001823 [Arthroderma sp. PD_2]|nr:hypothetical protein FQN49_001823 [Arthroderma sp. PD_2]
MDPVLQSSKMVIIQVGSRQKVYSLEETQTALATMQTMGNIQHNTSGVQDTLIRREGAGS